MAGQINAQVATWIIHPNYDSIYFATGTQLVITDSLNETIVWTPDGKRLFKTADKLHPFVEGIAVSTERDSDRITGFYTTDGKFTPLEKCSVAHDYPYFSDGYLVVKRGDKFYFADTKGQLNGQGVVMAYPFHHGFASCQDYKNKNKPKDIYNFLINEEKQKLSFSFKGKDFYPDDLEYISSVNDEGIGIIVARHKVYYFNGEKELKPVFATPDETNTKKQAKLNGKISECLIELDNSDFILYMGCGKTEQDQISCRFNSRMVPLEIGPNLNRIPFKSIRAPKEKQVSPLDITKKNHLFGLAIDGTQILPEQFEAIYECFNNNAFVKLSGKQGLLRIIRDESFLPIINDGKKICFRHGTVDKKIHIEMPAFIPAEKTFIESHDTSCIINKTSWAHKNTPQGNSIEYDCTLNFPSSLYNYTILYPDNPKQQTIKVTYPIQVTSEGIKFPEIPIEADVWYYKYITIDLNESNKTVKDGVGSFTFDIKAEIISDDDFYPLEVKIVADSSYLEPECEQLPSNNRRYKGTVYNLKEGPNDITIEILEDGCPPIPYPHTITYTKSSAKNKHKKEDIEIKKKAEEDELEEENNGIVPGL